MKYIKTYEKEIAIGANREPRFDYDVQVKLKLPATDDIYTVDYYKYDILKKEYVYYITDKNKRGYWANESNLRFLNQIEKDMETYNL